MGGLLILILTTTTPPTFSETTLHRNFSNTQDNRAAKQRKHQKAVKTVSLKTFNIIDDPLPTKCSDNKFRKSRDKVRTGCICQIRVVVVIIICSECRFAAPAANPKACGKSTYKPLLLSSTNHRMLVVGSFSGLLSPHCPTRESIENKVIDAVDWSNDNDSMQKQNTSSSAKQYMLSLEQVFPRNFDATFALRNHSLQQNSCKLLKLQLLQSVV